MRTRTETVSSFFALKIRSHRTKVVIMPIRLKPENKSIELFMLMSLDTGNTFNENICLWLNNSKYFTENILFII